MICPDSLEPPPSAGATKKAARDSRTRLVEEPWQVWRVRDFSRVHRIRGQLAGKGKGTRKRKYRAPTTSDPSLKEWTDCLAQPGAEGGMGCETFWDDHMAQNKEVSEAALEPGTCTGQ